MFLHRLLLTEVNCCHNELRIGRWYNKGVCWTDLIHVEVDSGLDIKIIIKRALLSAGGKVSIERTRYCQSKAIIFWPAQDIESRSANTR